MVSYPTDNPRFSFIMYHCSIVIQELNPSSLEDTQRNPEVFDFGILRNHLYFNKEKVTDSTRFGSMLKQVCCLLDLQQVWYYQGMV